MSTVPLHPAPPDVGQPGRPQSGLNYFVARTLGEVTEAWQMVYAAYHRDGLIDANPYELHTVPQAVGPSTVVVTGCLGPLAVGTLSAYADGPAGLPLDTVYREELAAMRAAGRRLLEVGLFADRREHMNRSAEGLFELMRFAFFFSLHLGTDDALIGVHPRHAPFYMRFFAFEQVGAVRSYPTVKDNPVLLLRLDVRATMKRSPLPKGFAYFLDNPVPTVIFEKRFRFDEPSMPGSSVARFLEDKRRAAAAAA